MTPGTRRRTVAASIEEARVSAIIRTDDQASAEKAMRAAIEGGFRVIEFTLTIPGALELVRAFSAQTDLTVGAGTVLTTDQARSAVAAGARFLVSPVVDPDVIREAAALDVPAIPGACTPTEMQAADRYGADFIKVFPAPAGGVSFIKAVRGPLPHLKLFPTAGATPENFLEFLDAGCAGVGFVRSLFEPRELASGDFGAIRDRAARIFEALHAWRSRRR